MCEKREPSSIFATRLSFPIDRPVTVILCFTALSAKTERLKRFSSYSGVNCHVIHERVEAKIILFLRNHSTSEKGIQDAFLFQEKMLLLFLLRKALPFICYRKVEIHYISLP